MIDHHDQQARVEGTQASRNDWRVWVPRAVRTDVGLVSFQQFLCASLYMLQADGLLQPRGSKRNDFRGLVACDARSR